MPNSFINANFGDLPNLITKMETRHLSLFDAIANYENILEYICNVPGEVGNKIKVKFQKSLSKNRNHDKICCIAKITLDNNKKFFLRPRIGCKYFLIKRWR